MAGTFFKERMLVFLVMNKLSSQTNSNRIVRPQNNSVIKPTRRWGNQGFDRYFSARLFISTAVFMVPAGPSWSFQRFALLPAAGSHVCLVMPVIGRDGGPTDQSGHRDGGSSAGPPIRRLETLSAGAFSRFL